MNWRRLFSVSVAALKSEFVGFLDQNVLHRPVIEVSHCSQGQECADQEGSRQFNSASEKNLNCLMIKTGYDN